VAKQSRALIEQQCRAQRVLWNDPEFKAGADALLGHLKLARPPTPEAQKLLRDVRQWLRPTQREFQGLGCFFLGVLCWKKNVLFFDWGSLSVVSCIGM
jgi:hypothetical protein